MKLHLLCTADSTDTCIIRRGAMAKEEGKKVT